MRRASQFAAISALVIVALSACGGSSGPSAEEEASAVAVRSVETDDAKLFCRKLASQRLLEEFVDGDAATCEKGSVVADDPGKAKVTAVSVTGEEEDRATVALKVVGGEADGTSGHLDLVKTGESWQLDRYGEDWLRSGLLAAMNNVDAGALATPSLKTCMGKQAQALSAERIKKIFIDATTDAEAMTEDLLPLAENCPKALAEYGANEFTRGLVEAGESPAYERCLHDEFEFLFLLTGIAPELFGDEPGFAAVAALEGIAEGAKKNCAAKR